jgi:hypothetical protein
MAQNAQFQAILEPERELEQRLGRVGHHLQKTVAEYSRFRFRLFKDNDAAAWPRRFVHIAEFDGWVKASDLATAGKPGVLWLTGIPSHTRFYYE